MNLAQVTGTQLIPCHETARLVPVAGAYDAEWCGSWHIDYADLHRRILAGYAPGRFAVAEVCTPCLSQTGFRLEHLHINLQSRAGNRRQNSGKMPRL